MSLHLTRRPFDYQKIIMKFYRLFSLLICCFFVACSFEEKPPALTPAVQPSKPELKIGLALGGGAARGFAHIGVIKALEDNGIQVDLLTGTSAGSVVAALYASGLSASVLAQLAQKMDEAEIADWALPFGNRYGGVIRGEALEKYMNRLLGGRTIEQMKKPLGIVATDLRTGKAVLFRYGNTGQAVRASSSIPGIFRPVTIAGHDYVDGGLVAPVPVKFARDMGANFVIAVNISADPTTQELNGLTGTLLQTTAVMGQTINQYELAQADVVIRPDLPSMRSTDFRSRHLAIAAGEKALLAKLPELREKLLRAQATNNANLTHQQSPGKP